MYQMSSKVEKVWIIFLFIVCNIWLLGGGVQVTKIYGVIVVPCLSETGRLFCEFLLLVGEKFSLSLALKLSRWYEYNFSVSYHTHQKSCHKLFVRGYVYNLNKEGIPIGKVYDPLSHTSEEGNSIPLSTAPFPSREGVVLNPCINKQKSPSECKIMQEIEKIEQ